MSKKRKRSFGDLSTEWHSLVNAMDGNLGDVPHLREARDELQGMLERSRSLLQQQAALDASKQEASQELRSVLDQAQKLAAFLRSGLRYRYGHRSEKLVEFGIQPLRKHRRSKSAQDDAEPDGATS